MEVKSKTEAMKERIEEAINEVENEIQREITAFDLKKGAYVQNFASDYVAATAKQIKEKLLELLSEEKEKEAVEFYKYVEGEYYRKGETFRKRAATLGGMLEAGKFTLEELFELYKKQQND